MAVQPRNQALEDAVRLLLADGRWASGPALAAEIGSFDSMDEQECDGTHDRDEYACNGRVYWRRLSCEPVKRRSYRGRAQCLHVYRHLVTSQEVNPVLLRLARQGVVRRRGSGAKTEWHKAGRWPTVATDDLETMFAMPAAEIDR